MGEKKVLWLELFYDLIFVAAVAKATHLLLHVEEGIVPAEYLFKFILIFIPIWWAWVGQTLFINRYGEDCFSQRIFMIIQMVFVVLMTASLSSDFDPYYVPFLIGYAGIRFVTSLQYLWVLKRKSDSKEPAAKYLGFGFLIGIAISLSSVFFDPPLRYAVLYLGIFADLAVPVLGRRYLSKAPANSPHLLERFGLFTIILFGECIVSLIAILHLEKGDWGAIFFTLVSLILIAAMWWQYFDNLEKKVDKEKKTTGQRIIYGHLFIFMSLSAIAAAIQLAYLHKVDHHFLTILSFGAAFVYFLSTALVFHRFRFVHHRLRVFHFGLLAGILVLFMILDFVLPVPSVVIFVQLAFFFILYAKIAPRG
ncbi:low temperature requirement protein A [Bacillus sp. FJAT-42376]|uniref:low temperature requirement protein A n=1 Tax=Bacillus sp. FJAT-42376 TaxID=2014076 RepID=UPI000F4E0887|nr:low temperature requirement protein A [Bacillus sp. FJAT-42376]AZB42637.1 low temperature requirement protein A [Bacillus sp. FJAT-42376]